MTFDDYIGAHVGAAEAWLKLTDEAPKTPKEGIHASPLDAEADDVESGGWFFSWEKSEGFYLDIEVGKDGSLDWFAKTRDGAYAGGVGDPSGIRFAVDILCAFRAEREQKIRAEERERIARALEVEADFGAFHSDVEPFARHLMFRLRAGTFPPPQKEK